MKCEHISKDMLSTETFILLSQNRCTMIIHFKRVWWVYVTCDKTGNCPQFLQKKREKKEFSHLLTNVILKKNIKNSIWENFIVLSFVPEAWIIAWMTSRRTTWHLFMFAIAFLLIEFLHFCQVNYSHLIPQFSFVATIYSVPVWIRG